MTWLVVLGVGVGSYLFRVGPLLALHRITLSARAERVIRHAGTAAVTALIAVSARQSAAGGTAVPTLLAVVAGVWMAARGASMVRILFLGGGLYAGAVLVLHVVP